MLIPLTPRPCVLASSVTTPLYNTTVTQALRPSRLLLVFNHPGLSDAVA